MKKKLSLLIFVLIFGIFSELYSQQIFISSQYLFNKYIINPAVAGTESMPVLNFSYRQNWSGLNNAPNEQLISIHSPFYKGIGMGAKIFKVTTGPLSKTAVEGTYCYRFPINDFKLSLGISGLIYQYSIDKSKITLEDPNDDALLKSSNNLIVPDANFGAFMYNENLYFGFAIFQLFNRNVDMMNSKNIKQQQVRHYFFNTGYKFNLNKNLALEPSALLKVIEAGVFQADLDLLCTYMKTFSLGAAYRTNDAFILMVNIINNRVSFGYSYDIPLSAIKTISRGSHEIVISYKFKSSRNQPFFDNLK